MTTELIKKSDEMAGIFTELKVGQHELFVRIDNEQETTYTTTVIEFDAFIDDPFILIAPLTPGQGDRIIEDSSSISVEFTLGESYTFKSVYLGRQTLNDRELLKISYPNKRKYYRVWISYEDKNKITLEIDSQTKIDGVIKDISPLGVGFYIDGNAAGPEDIHRVHRASFELPDGTVINSRVEIRYVTSMPYTNGIYFFCGALFLDMEGEMFDRIIQYTLERKLEEEEV